MVKNHLLERKELSVLLVFALILSLAGPVFAEDINTDAVFTVGSAVAFAGEEGILVSVSVQDSPEFVAAGLQFTFPGELTLTDIKRGSDLSGGTISENVSTGLVNFDWDEAAFPDGEIFVIEFTASEYAQSGDYEIGVAIADIGWNDNVPNDLIPKSMVPGKITITGLNVAEVGSTEYSSLSAALTAAIDSGQPAIVTMISNAMVADASDRVVIPDGADITLDMNGFTIASALDGCSVDQNNKPIGDSVGSGTVEVQAGGKLNIVDNSTNGGGTFTHTTGDRYTRFLINSGTLNMSDVVIDNFYDGIRDGSYYVGKGSGTYGMISNCEFTASDVGGVINNYKTALNFGAGTADTVENCVITGYDVDNARSIVVGTYSDGNGGLEWLEDCTIYGLMVVSKQGTINTIKDSTIINAPEGDDFACAIEIDGYVGTIDGGYIEGVYDAINVSMSGSIDYILDGEFKAWDQALYNYGKVGEISGGNFEVGHYNALCNVGSINIISGGEFKSASYRALYNEEGYIGEISGGTFIAGSSYYGVTNKGGTIDKISGGLFYSESYNAFRNGDSYAYKKSVINLISGGTFVNNANSSTFACADPGQGSTIGEISGGTFISKNESAILISGNVSGVEKISGGTFIGKVAAIKMNNNTIESISGGVFFGEEEAVYLDGATDDHEAHINDISGGYFKTLGEYGLIVALGDSSWSSEGGYNFATIPLREQNLPEDFPDEEIIEDRTGFYHFGEIVDVTWVVSEDEEDEPVVDKFVIGDPVYYNYEEPIKPDEAGFSFRFKAWEAGANQYRSDDPLPDAVEGGATYTALFEQIGSEEDYEVNLNTNIDNVNIGEAVDVDIIVNSTGNVSFYGATIGVKYDPAKVEVDEISGVAGTFDTKIVQNADSTETLEIMCHNPYGYTIGENGYSFATISFKTLAAGSVSFGIAENPVIDQEGATESTAVTAGNPVQLNVWNLTVTFQAGDNVSFAGVTGGQVSAYVKYNEAVLYTDTGRGTEFTTAPTPKAADYYTIDGADSGLVWKLEGGNIYYSFADIASTKFTANAVFTATASPTAYSITYPVANVILGAGIVEGKVIYNTDATFTVSPDKGYTVDKVYYKLGDGEWTELTAVANVYTIPGGSITDDITIKVEQLVAGAISFISNDDYKALPDGFKLLKLIVTEKLETGAYEYDGKAMFYSSMYSNVDENSHVYLYAILNSVDEDTARVDLTRNIEAVDTCIELNYDGDVTLESGVNSTDAILTYALYIGTHKNDANFTKVALQKRLEADVNGDETVDTTDVQKIFGNWRGK